MKNLIMTVFTVALITSCGSGEAEKKAAAEEVAKVEMMTNEISQLDSISEVLENATSEIESTSNELNDLLNEL